MLSVAIIIFREVFEIALVVGVLLAATRGMTGRRRWINSGIVLGVLGAAVLAFFTGALSESFGGAGQEFFNAAVLFAAAGLIAWTVVWLQVHGRRMAEEIKQIGKAVASSEKPLHTLAIVAGLSTLREGSEAVLFSFGVLTSGQSVLQVAAGCAAGLLAGSAAGAALYLGLVKIPTRQLFSVTSFLLVFLAAGMVSQALGLLASAGSVPLLVPMLWDTSAILPQSALAGKTLHVLFGYVDKPSGIQGLGYLCTLVMVPLASRYLQMRAVDIQNRERKKGVQKQ